MSNPYEILNKMILPDDNISTILSFCRPSHPLTKSILNNFNRCGGCNRPVHTWCPKIRLCYYTIEKGCGRCGKIGELICGECTPERECGCDDETGSWYSWFSF